jgi:hypothetical protein
VRIQCDEKQRALSSRIVSEFVPAGAAELHEPEMQKWARCAQQQSVFGHVHNVVIDNHVLAQRNQHIHAPAYFAAANFRRMEKAAVEKRSLHHLFASIDLNSITKIVRPALI